MKTFWILAAVFFILAAVWKLFIWEVDQAAYMLAMVVINLLFYRIEKNRNE